MYKIILYKNQQIFKELLNDNLSFIAGALSISIPILEKLNTNKYNSNLNNDIYKIECDADVSSFRVMADVFEDDIPIRSKNKLKFNEFGIWIKSDINHYYNLFKTKNAKFFQGLITFATIFNEDFRTYFYGLPFDFEGGKYVLDGYEMEYDAPYAIPYDLLKEEEYNPDDVDNENLIEFLHKDY